MGKSYSVRIRGDCVNVPQDNNMMLFKTVNCHIVCSSPNCNPFESGLMGCKASNFSPMTPYTEVIPEGYVFPNSLNMGRKYGGDTTDKSMQLKTPSGKYIYFNSSDYDKIKKRSYCPYYRGYAQGPAVQSAHCFVDLQRKLNNVNTYENRLEYDFVDAYQTIPEGADPVCGKGCKTNNWLGFVHPAASLYTSITEPFRISNFYEESGESPSTNSSLGGFNFIPFCSSITARDSDGTALGSYIGYTFVAIFGLNCSNFPCKRYLPEDPYDTAPTNKRKINPRMAIYGLELWAFWVGAGGIGSPLISKHRFWFNSLAPGNMGQISNWMKPFAILFKTPGFYGGNSKIVNCRVLNQPDVKDIEINLTNLQGLITY